MNETQHIIKSALIVLDERFAKIPPFQPWWLVLNVVLPYLNVAKFRRFVYG